MSDTNVQSGGGVPTAPSAGGGAYGSHAGGGLGHLHHHGLSGLGAVADTLTFGLGFFPDPDMNSKSLPPFSSFGGEGDGLAEGLSGRLLDLGGGGVTGSGAGGPPPWDLYGEGLSARLIDVGAPTPLGLGIGVGVGLGLGFAPPPPTAVPANSGPPGSIQYRPWESKNHPHPPGGPENGSGTLLELGRMATPTSSSSASIPSFTEMFPTPKLPSFQSQFQAFQANTNGTPATPSPAPPNGSHPPAPPNGHDPNAFQGQTPHNGSRYTTLTPLQPLRPDAGAAAHPHHPHPHGHHPTHHHPHGHPAPFLDQRSSHVAYGAVNPFEVQGHGHHAAMHHVQHATPNNGAFGRMNGSHGMMTSSSPAIKMEMDDSRSPFSSQGSLPSRGDVRKKEKVKITNKPVTPKELTKICMLCLYIPN